MWATFWRKDPNSSITANDLADVCRAMNYPYDPKRLFKCLAPLFGARTLVLRDLVPLFAMTRKMAALGQAKPRAALRNALATTARLTPAVEEPSVEGALVTRRTPAILREMMSRVHGNTVAAWCKAFDPQGRGFVTMCQFSAALPKCELYGDVKGLWKGLTQGNETLPFRKIDPESQERLDGCREHLVARFGCVLQGWHAGLNKGGLGKLDEEDFILSCKSIEMPPAVRPKVLFRLLLARLGQRSVGIEDMKPLLVGVPPASRNAIWGEPIKLGGTLGAVVEAASPRELAESLVAQSRLPDPTLEQFRNILAAKFGSLFGAWRQALNRGKTGVVSQKDFAQACRDLGIQGGKKLWAEIDVGSRGQISLEEFDLETAQAFGKFEQCLISQFGHPREGWKEMFDHQGLVRVEKQKFIAGCKLLGYDGDAEQLFHLLIPEHGRTFLTYHDLWLDLNRNTFQLKTAASDVQSPLKTLTQNPH